MVGTTPSDSAALFGWSALTSGTPTQFNPSRIQPFAGEVINKLPVVYLDLYKEVKTVMHTGLTYLCNLVVSYCPSIDYTSESDFNPHDINKVVRFLCNLVSTSEYSFDFAQIIAYLKLYLDDTSNLTDRGTYRQRTVYANMDSVSNVPEWFLHLREVIASILGCTSNMLEVDYWIQREGKFIIRLLSLLIDNDRKNIGRIVIEEDPYI